MVGPSTLYIRASTTMSNHSNLTFFANSSITQTRRQHYGRKTPPTTVLATPLRNNSSYNNQLRHLLISPASPQHSTTTIASITTTTTSPTRDFLDNNFKVNSIIENLHAVCDRARVTDTMISLLPPSGQKAKL